MAQIISLAKKPPAPSVLKRRQAAAKSVRKLDILTTALSDAQTILKLGIAHDCHRQGQRYFPHDPFSVAQRL
jgi:hypothetical protein